jgi:anti-anti-sigma factor
MTITSDVFENAVVIRVAGRLDAVAAPELERTCIGQFQTGAKNILIDFMSLEYIGSAGLRAILASGKALHASGGALGLCAPEGTIKNVLNLAGFCSLFPVYESLEECPWPLPKP